jgi:hypothetical protein
MANRSKYEYITFVFAVSGLLLAARGQLFLAGLISVLAIEVQPIGIMAPVYIIAYELSRMIQTGRYRLEFDRVAKLGFGGLMGVAVYLMLHPPSWGYWRRPRMFLCIKDRSISVRVFL